jgi:peptidoglycan/LPS O-acetylase OafA/YrhL
VIDSRSAALDFSRFSAAVIVFLGHLLFLPTTFLWTPNTTRLLDPLRTGETAVLFFFALSGYVLAISDRDYSYPSWIGRRLLRLFPVYIVAWIFGLVLLTAHNLRLPDLGVLILGISGMSAANSNFNLISNPPLWSLSTEIMYAFILFYLLKLKSRPLLLMCALIASIFAWSFFTEAPILRAAPYFLIGVLLRNQWFIKLKIDPIIALSILVIVGVFFILKGASLLLLLSYSIEGEVPKIILVGLLIFLFSKIQISGSLGRYSIEAGKRSFCLYAFHYPILLIFNFLIEPDNKTTMTLYVFLAISTTLGITELTYRYIDRTSTGWAKKLTG